MEVGEREIIYLSLHCHHQIDSCIKMGSDETHFNVSVGSDAQSHRTVSTNHNLSEEKGERKRYRTEVLPFTNLTPYSVITELHIVSPSNARRHLNEICTLQTAMFFLHKQQANM